MPEKVLTNLDTFSQTFLSIFHQFVRKLMFDISNIKHFLSSRKENRCFTNLK